MNIRSLVLSLIVGAACTATVPDPDPDRWFAEHTWYIQGFPGEELCEEWVELYNEGTAFGGRCDSDEMVCGGYERRDGTIFVQISELDGGREYSFPEAGGDGWRSLGLWDEPVPDCGDD